LDLIGGDNSTWDALVKAQQSVELRAKKGKRLEVWVTAVGHLETRARLSPRGPCDKIGSRYSGVRPTDIISLFSLHEIA